METAQLSPDARVLKALGLIEEDHLSFRAACEQAGINKGEAWKAMQRDAELATRYARAREARGMAQGEAVADLGSQVLSGVYPPDVARVALDAMKWSAARMAPKFYGDASTLELTGAGGGPVDVAVVQRLIVDPKGEAK